MPFWRGERDPKKLASLVDRRVKKSQAQIEAALTGDYRPELLFVVSQALHGYRQMQQQIAQCDLNIDKQLATIAACTEPKQTPPPQQGAAVKARTSKRKPKDALELSLAGHSQAHPGSRFDDPPWAKRARGLEPDKRDRN
jgi:transposase